MSSTTDDPFSFVQDNRPSFFQQLLLDLHEFVAKSFGLDLQVWMGRLVVSILIVLAWEVYCNPPQQPRLQQRKTKQPLRKEELQPSSERKTALQETKQETNTESTNVSAEKISNQDNGEANAPEEPETSPTVLEETKSAPLEPTPTTESTKSTSEQKSDDTVPSVDTNVSTPKATPTAVPNATVWKDPGLGGFHRWYEAETSLYRIYTLAHKELPTVPPYAPSSQRGRVPVELHVTNTIARDLNVYWVDYKGKHIPKGKISKHSGVWTQTTWIDHPWVFEDALTGTPYLYFVPYQVIPTTPQAPTVGSDGSIGVQKFAIVEATDDSYYIGVSDNILPLSSELDQPLKAIQWTLSHLSRRVAIGNLVQSETLQKYLVNILNHPEVYKYRNLRIASKRFETVWNSPLQGLLLAVGFVESCGYCTLGTTATLPSHKIQDVALLSYLLHEWTRKELAPQSQPAGAVDGFGRAGFGRAGAME